jgi:hypothetical protein
VGHTSERLNQYRSHDILHLQLGTDMRYSPVVGEVVIPTGETEELITYLRDQWHLLVRADNLLGPRHALGGVLSQLDILTAVC